MATKTKTQLAKKLLFWIQFHEGQKKIWLNLFLSDDAGDNKKELEKYLTKSLIIMDLQEALYPRGHGAWNWDIISIENSKRTFAPYLLQKFDYEITKSPEELLEIENKKESDKKLNTQIQKVVKSKKEIPLTAENLEIQNDGTIDLSFPTLQVKEKIDFPKIWDILEKDFIGKINEGDVVTLIDAGNKIFELRGGSFLNVGLADLKIYDAKKRKGIVHSIFNDLVGLKGGAFIRDDGRIVVGNLDRTFYLEIFTNNLLKSSLKLKKSMMEITQTKLLK